MHELAVSVPRDAVIALVGAGVGALGVWLIEWTTLRRWRRVDLIHRAALEVADRAYELLAIARYWAEPHRVRAMRSGGSDISRRKDDARRVEIVVDELNAWANVIVSGARRRRTQDVRDATLAALEPIGKLRSLLDQTRDPTTGDTEVFTDELTASIGHAEQAVNEGMVALMALHEGWRRKTTKEGEVALQTRR